MTLIATMFLFRLALIIGLYVAATNMPIYVRMERVQRRVFFVILLALVLFPLELLSAFVFSNLL